MSDNETADQKAQRIAVEYMNTDETRIGTYYDSMGPEVYEKVMDIINFNDLYKINEAVKKLELERDCEVLDVGAGTGRLGKMLSQEGFTTIDAVDACASFLEKLNATGAYRQHTQLYLGEGQYPNPEAENKYNLVVASGVFLDKHVPATGIPEIVRALK